MERHLRKHTGLKKAHCQTCNKNFERKDSLLEHEASVACRSRMQMIQQKSNEMISPRQDHEAYPGVSPSSTTVSSGEALGWHAGIDNGAGKRFCNYCNTWFSRFDLFLKHVMDVCPFSPNGQKGPSQGINHGEEPSQQVSRPAATGGGVQAFNTPHSSEQVFDPLFSGRDDRSQSQVVVPNLTMGESAENNSAPGSVDILSSVGHTDYNPQLQCFVCPRKHSSPQEYVDHLNQHMIDAIGPCRYTCNGCETGFHHLFELDEHQKAVKQLKKGEGRCHSCGHVFGNLSVRVHEHLGVHLKGFKSPAGLHGYCYQMRLDKNSALIQRIQDQIARLYINNTRGT